MSVQHMGCTLLLGQKQGPHNCGHLIDSEHWEVIIQIKRVLKQVEMHGWLQSKQVFIQ